MMSSPSCLDGAFVTLLQMGGVYFSVSTPQTNRRWIPFRAEMWPPRGSGDGARDLDGALAAATTVAAMISGISTPHPTGGGGRGGGKLQAGTPPSPRLSTDGIR